MDPISGLNQLIQLLRKRLSNQSEAPATRSKATGTTRCNSTVTSKASLAEIQKLIGERIRTLQPQERHSAKAAQIFVESVLVWEFGEHLLQDPNFSELSQEVQTTLMADSHTWKMFQTILDNC